MKQEEKTEKKKTSCWVLRTFHVKKLEESKFEIQKL